jgi:hypothetical protein
MRANISKAALGVMLAALLVPTMGSDGCRRSCCGNSTDVSFGFDAVPSFGFGDWGFTDSSYSGETYYDAGYYDGGSFDDGSYDDGSYDDGFYGGDFKAKKAGRRK